MYCPFCDRNLHKFYNIVIVQPSGFTVTESAHLKFAIRQRGRFHFSLDAFTRTLQQVQSPGLNCYITFLKKILGLDNDILLCYYLSVTFL